jgi:Tfp pilus assembly protein PilF
MKKKKQIIKKYQLTEHNAQKLQHAFQAHAKGDNEKAIMLCESIIGQQPEHCDAYHLIGCILGGVKNYIPALQYFNLSIERNPNNAIALNNRGNIFQALKQSELAILDFERAIQLDPKYAEAYYNKGIVLGHLYRLEEEVEHYEKAIKIKPNFPEAYNNKAIALQKLHRMEETLEAYQAGIAQNPKHIEAFYNNRGLVYQNLGRVEEALVDYDKAIELVPDLADARFNRSLCLLLLGKYDTAWEEHEWRFKRSNYPRRQLPGKLWLGEEDLNGKTLFIHGEQGLGDMLQFCRYAKLAKEHGAKVILGTENPLVRLLSNLEGVDEIVTTGGLIPDFHYHTPLMSLPYAFKTTLENIPHGIYIKPDPGLKKPTEFLT